MLRLVLLVDFSVVFITRMVPNTFTWPLLAGSGAWQLAAMLFAAMLFLEEEQLLFPNSFQLVSELRSGGPKGPSSW